MEVRPFLLGFYCPYLYYKGSHYFAFDKWKNPIIVLTRIHYVIGYQAYCIYLTFAISHFFLLSEEIPFFAPKGHSGVSLMSPALAERHPAFALV